MERRRWQLINVASGRVLARGRLVHLRRQRRFYGTLFLSQNIPHLLRIEPVAMLELIREAV